MGRDRYRDAREKREGGGYVAFPHEVLNSVAYIGLSAHARMLLLDIAAQYKGNNNGDLCAAWTLMRARGWRSEDTLNNAKRQFDPTPQNSLGGFNRSGQRFVQHLGGCSEI
jgi:hypothetical protein